ncbi:MAG: prephenate dehydrogenase/arogenate dehydrogenase family protein [Steroidobacteraceae bacterium]
MTLEELRARLNTVDRQLVELIAERQALSKKVAEAKRTSKLPTRDFKREREVLLRARASATELGISPDLTESILRMLIRGSLTTQEREQVAAGNRGSGRTALVIGGAGKMGGWFSEFLASQGYRVSINDPSGTVPGFEHVPDWARTPLDFDLIVVATPLAVGNSVLQQLAEHRPRGVIFDLGSLKTPLRQGLQALRDAGCKVTSVHPMFGPDTELLSGRHVIFVDMGNEEALHAAQDLFSATMAERAVMTLDEHDRLIAYVLGLSHALNIAFFTALAESGEAAPRLAQLSSTTYDAQVDVATRVSVENPELYFEIQSLNEYGRESLQALRSSVERLWQAVAQQDQATFVRLMQQGREYLAGRVRER